MLRGTLLSQVKGRMHSQIVRTFTLSTVSAHSLNDVNVPSENCLDNGNPAESRV